MDGSQTNGLQGVRSVDYAVGASVCSVCIKVVGRLHFSKARLLQQSSLWYMEDVSGFCPDFNFPNFHFPLNDFGL